MSHIIGNYPPKRWHTRAELYAHDEPELLVSITLKPPAPGVIESVTVQVVAPPLSIVAGEHTIDDATNVSLSAVRSGGVNQ